MNSSPQSVRRFLTLYLLPTLASLSLTVPAYSQTLDDFNPVVRGESTGGEVYSLALHADGKVLVGGYFSNLCGQRRYNLGRLNSDGTRDQGFYAETGSWPFALGVQADGKVLVGAWEAFLAGRHASFGRLNPDGSMDADFNPAPTYTGPNIPGVYALGLQPDGKIIVGGAISNLAGVACTNIGRLNPDGSRDTTFRASANNLVYSLALQPDGAIVIGGSFTNVCGLPRSRIARLNPDGSLDLSFNPGANDIPMSLVVQPDGKLLAGGAFTSLGGQTRRYLARLNTDGSLDESFTSSASDIVRCLTLQADGKILVGGAFFYLNSVNRVCLGRLNADGSLDTTFNLGAAKVVFGLTVQPDGKILVGGSFSTLGGQPRSGIGRLNNTTPAVQQLTLDNSTLTWLRSGSSPEVWRVDFDASTNGTDWFSLGPGTRIAGGWQASNLNLPPGATVRARGAVASGRYNASLWFADASIGPPAFSLLPMSRTNLAGTQAAFYVQAAGTPPFGYQWCKNGVPLDNGGNVLGADASTLVLSNLSSADIGGYSVVVTNTFGKVASAAAALAVIRPEMFGAGTYSNAFGVNIPGVPGESVMIQVSTNLIQWTDLETKFVPSGGVAFFSEIESNALSPRFYRIQY